MGLFSNVVSWADNTPTYTPKIVHYRDLIREDDMAEHGREKARLKNAYLGKCRPLPSGEVLPPYYKQILQSPHTLIAGTTGCGKSTFLHNVIYELMGTYTPREACMVLIDPKRIELVDYRDTLYCIGYAMRNDEALDLLEDSVDLIESRYTTMQALGIKQWNGAKCYIIIDELADLLIDGQNGLKVKRTLQKILQIGRASGVSVIACTQAPARKIIPAELTLNFTDKIGMRCDSATESRQIIGVKGCEVLRGYGKAYYKGLNGLSAVVIPRLQEDTRQVRIDYWL